MDLNKKISLSEEIKKAESQLPMFLITLGILALALGATVCGWWYTQNILHQYAKARFESDVKETKLLIQERLETYIDALYGIQGLFAASKEVERDEWAAYIRKVNLKGRYPGISAVRFIQRVEHADKEVFIESVRNDTSLTPAGYPDFTIHPAGDRSEYLVMKYVEPYGEDSKMLGSDVGQEPTRRDAMERARDLGEPAATGRTFLDAPSGKAVGFVIFLPIYKNGVPISTLEERRQALVGYVDGKFIAKDLLSGIFSKKGVSPGVDFEIFDGSVLTEDHLVYDENPERLDAGSVDQKWLHEAVTLNFAGRSWYFDFTSSSGYGPTPDQANLPVFVLVSGSIFSLLLALVFYSLATSRYQALKLAEQMTGSLLESEERFRSLAQAAPEAIISADSQGNMIFWSRGAQRIFGYTEKEVLGKSLTLIMPERYREGHRKGLERLRATGQPVLIGKTVEMEGLKKDGSELPIELSLAMWTTAKGAFYSGIIRDVTERKKADEKIRGAETFLNSIVENLPSMVFVKEAKELRFVQFNKAGEELLGYSREEMIGKNDYDFFPKEEADFFTGKDRQVLSQGEIVDIPEEPIHTKKQGVRYLHTKKVPVFDQEGKPLYLLGISEDITNRKLADETLRESEALYTDLFREAPDPIVTLDLLGHIQTVNRAAERITGFHAEELVGKHFVKVGVLTSGSLGIAVKEFALVVAGRERPPFEVEILRKDGTPLILEVNPRLLMRQEKASGVQVIFRNITERRQMERKLLQNTEELARAATEREQLEFFAYVASHDLQEPLQKIIAFGDLLEAQCRETLDPKGKDYVERMQKAALRMSQLVDDLLRFSQVKKKAELLETVNLNDVLFEALQDLELRIRETKGRVDYTKLATIKADRLEMHQLFQNLISNGLKFYRKDEPPRVLVRSRHLEDGSVEIAFEDNGIGFNEKYLDRIFKPFERLHGRGEYEGSGIGLAICQKIVRDHGGTITAKSVLGKGSVFIVILPSGDLKRS